jgi:aspartate aminotransferase
MARFAKRVLAVQASPTVRLSDLVSQLKSKGEKILSLAIGEPDFPTPAHIVAAAKKALDDGYTKYTPAMGIPELREAVAEKSVKDNRIPATAENVLIAPTKHALYETCMALLQEGDECLIPDPGWVSYGPMVELASATPVPVAAADEEGFVPRPDDLAERVTRRTRMIMLNSPSNPGGSVYPRSTMQAIADLAEDHDLIVVSDEIYEKIRYDGEHVSPASLDGMFDRTITVNGFSKTYAMTGWRLGWLVAPKPILAEIAKVQEHTITCCTAFAQKAGVAALRGPTAPLTRMVSEFRARRDLILKEIKKSDRMTCVTPDGAFYAFPRFEVPADDSAVSERLLKDAKVAVTPGSAFGEAGAGHLRLSYASSRKTITEAMGRIRETLDAL